jgi:hypothetical protein
MTVELTTFEDLLALANTLRAAGVYTQIDAHQAGPVVTGVLKHWTAAWSGDVMAITDGTATAGTGPVGDDLNIDIYLNGVPQSTLTIPDGETLATPGTITGPIAIARGDLITIAVTLASGAEDLAVAVLITGYGGDSGS